MQDAGSCCTIAMFLGGPIFNTHTHTHIQMSTMMLCSAEADLSIRLDNQGIPSLQTGSVPLHTPLARHVLKPVPTNSNPVSQVYVAVDPGVSPVTTVTLPSSTVSEGHSTENNTPKFGGHCKTNIMNSTKVQNPRRKKQVASIVG